MNEREEGKFIGEENRKQMVKLARESMVSNGKLYLERYGEKQVEADLEELRRQFVTWNAIGETSARVNVDSITLMISVMAMVPVQLGKLELLSDPKLVMTTTKLSAIRNLLVKQRAELLAKSNPDLSTP